MILNSIQLFALEDSNRIQSLLPKGITLNIEPYIPVDFVLHDYGYIYIWAPKEFKIEKLATKEFNRPFIQMLKYESGRPKNQSFKDFITDVIKGYEGIYSIEAPSFHWGEYEVFPLRVNATFDEDHVIFVDLNNDEGGFLIFNFQYPKKDEFGNGNRPSKSDLSFWDDFLKKTKPLNINKK